MVKILSITLPLRLRSVANLREHWAVRHRRNKDQTAIVTAALNGHERPALPCVVSLTRVGKRRLDSDNLQAGFKSVRDAVARWLGADDGSPLIEWEYGQIIGSKYEICVEISERTNP